MLIKREEFKKDGIDYECLYYGKDADHISAKVERPIQTEPVEPTEPKESVDTEEVLAEILMNQTAIKQKQEEQDETLAMLLLNNDKGE